jgi:hypothetical protein
MDRSPVPCEPSRRAGERRNGNLIHIKPSTYVTSSTGITKCLRPHCKYRYGESLRRFLPAEATQPPNVPRTNMEIKKRLKGTALPPAAFMSDLPTGAVRGCQWTRDGRDQAQTAGRCPASVAIRFCVPRLILQAERGTQCSRRWRVQDAKVRPGFGPSCILGPRGCCSSEVPLSRADPGGRASLHASSIRAGP